METQVKGDWAELRVASALRKQGHTVLVPFTESEQYDLAADTTDGEFVKVQVKYAKQQDDGTIEVCCVGTNSSKTGNNRTFYTNDEIDGIACFCGDLDRCFWIPFDSLNKWQFTLSEDGKNTFDDYKIERF
jgi:Protein of unknown function (DUF3257).